MVLRHRACSSSARRRQLLPHAFLARSTLLVVLFAVLALPRRALSAENRTLEIVECLLKRGVGETHITPSGSTDFAAALAESVIQDPIKTPQVFVRPGNANGVVHAVKCARQTDVKFCARSGGHSWSSSSICSGLVIDLQRLNGLDVNKKSDAVVVGAGKTLGETLYELYTTTGKIIPTGTCPSVGIGGYVQGGGFGTLSGELGLLADNVKFMTVVTPAGDKLRVSKKDYKNLFWGLTGGGGGYLGIVTEIGLHIHPAQNTYDRNVYFSYSWSMESGPEALYQWTKYPILDDGSLYIRMNLVADRQGQSVRAVGVCWKVDSVGECNKKLASYPLWDVPGRTKRLALKSKQGVLETAKFFTSDGRYGNAQPSGSWNSGTVFNQRFVTKAYLSDRSWGSLMWSERMMNSSTNYFKELLDLMETQRREADMRSITMEFYPLGAKVRQLPSDYSAFPHRDAIAVMAAFYNGGVSWRRRAAKRKVQNYLSPFSIGTYVSYQDLDLKWSEFRKQYWGANRKKLAALRQRLDKKKRMWHPQPLT